MRVSTLALLAFASFAVAQRGNGDDDENDAVGENRSDDPSDDVDDDNNNNNNNNGNGGSGGGSGNNNNNNNNNSSNNNDDDDEDDGCDSDGEDGPNCSRTRNNPSSTGSMSTQNGNTQATRTMGGATVTTGPQMITGAPGAGACATATSFYAACGAATQRFTELDFKVQASCLCYNWVSQGAWEPTVFDQNFRTCNTELRSAAPSAYRSLRDEFDDLNDDDDYGDAPCQSIGNIRRASTTATYGVGALQAVPTMAGMTAAPGTGAGSASNGGAAPAPTSTGGAQAPAPGSSQQSTSTSMVVVTAGGSNSNDGSQQQGQGGSSSSQSPQVTGNDAAANKVLKIEAGLLAGMVGGLALL